MLLDLTRYRQPVTHLDLSLAASDVQQEGDSYAIAAPVELSLDVHKDKEVFRLAGRVRTTLELPCSRCVEPFRLQVDSLFDLRYLPASAMSLEDEREIPEEDLETSVYQDDRIDLNDMLREQFYLALPMKPLCVETCCGLCPVCGTNRNEGACACSTEWTDPRLEPLRALKDGNA